MCGAPGFSAHISLRLRIRFSKGVSAVGYWELFFLAIGLSMDAFAASICTGLSLSRPRVRDALIVGAWFGAFQALMPLAGWMLGAAFARRMAAIDHWIAFILLGFIGGNMIVGGLSRNRAEERGTCLGAGKMLPLALATSIDALAVGVTFAFLNVDLLPAVCLIGSVTFALSALGAALGRICGAKYRAGAEILGGAVLITMGVKVLLEHLGIW